jgi:hypothetical protein
MEYLEDYNEYDSPQNHQVESTQVNKSKETWFKNKFRVLKGLI